MSVGTFMGRLTHAVWDEISEVPHNDVLSLLGSAWAEASNNEITNSDSMISGRAREEESFPS